MFSPKMPYQRMSWVARLVTALVISSAIATPVAALDVRNVIADFTVTGWTHRDGLSPGAVLAIAQDRDGFIWIGTAFGLYIFDGSSIDRWHGQGSQRLPQTRVRALSSDGAGGILAAFDGQPPLFARISNGRAEVSVGDPGYDHSTVTFLTREGNTVWMGTQHGLYWYEQGQWRKLQGDGLPDDTAVYSRLQTGAGALFVGTSLGIFRREASANAFTAIERFVHKAERAWEDIPFGLIERSDGTVYVRDCTQGLRPVTAHHGSNFGERGRGQVLFKDHNGNIWLGTMGQGVWKIGNHSDSHVERLTTATGLLGDGIYAILEDGDGNIWLGTTEGLNRLTPKKVEQVSEVAVAVSVGTLRDGTMVVATPDELLRFADGNTAAQPKRTALEGAMLSAMYIDDSDRVWVGTSRGLVWFDGHDDARPVIAAETELFKTITSITGDGRGGVWLFDESEGLRRWNHGLLLPPSSIGDLISSVTYLYTDRKNTVWAGLGDGRIVAVNKDHKFALYGKEQGLPTGIIRAIFEDPQGGIWVAADFGIAKHTADDRFKAAVGTDALPLRSATALVTDKAGMLWIGTNSGLLVVNPTDLDSALMTQTAPVPYRRFGRPEGLAGLPGRYYPSSSVARSRDGRLWFVTGRGVTIVDPSNLPHSEPPHAVHITGVEIDDKAWDYPLNQAIPAATSHLSIAYSAPNLTAPTHTRFAYKLEGYDNAWINAGTRHQAFYTNLPPGAYRFRVVARSDDAAWSDTEQVWNFTIPPHFYQTTGFMVGMCGLVVAAIVGGWRLRVAQMHRRFALVLRERARLSREIHDTLLQGLVGVALQLDAIGDPDQERTLVEREWLVRMRKTLECYIREARQSILALRSTKLQVSDLASAVRDSAISIINGRPITLAFEVTGEQVRLEATAELALLRISGEAISNAVRHSRADHLKVALGFSDSVRLTVQDTGIGFKESQQGGSTSHFGLAMMRERAAEVGAEVEIMSQVGVGTTVDIRVPLAL